MSFKANVPFTPTMLTPLLVSIDKKRVLTIYPFEQYVEDFLFTFGLDGKGCLLRAICEMHESPLLGYGLVGEIINVFLT